MKYILIALISVLPAFANADPGGVAKKVFERTMFNARNGESHVCKIYSDNTTEIFREGSSMGKFKLQYEASDAKVQGWLKALKADANFARIMNAPKGMESVMARTYIKQYTQRGVREYAAFDFNTDKKVPFYRMRAHKPGKKDNKRVGSVRFKFGPEQELRGQIDYACKMATLAVRE